MSIRIRFASDRFGKGIFFFTGNFSCAFTRFSIRSLIASFVYPTPKFFSVIAAASYAEGGSVEELERKITEKNATAKTARSEIVYLEHEMKAKAEILKYAKQYVANRKYQRGYEKAKDQDAYFRSHETQIILFGGAENMLKRYGIKTTSLDVEKMQAEYDAMTVQKAKLKKTYQTAEKEVVEADKAVFRD